jgi:thiamine biosynthesis lipoprotein
VPWTRRMADSITAVPPGQAAGMRAGRAGHVRVEHLMGTTIGIALRDERPLPREALDGIFGWLDDVDATFSTFRHDSEISRLGRGELREEECSPRVRHVLALCDDLCRTSGGYFDARHYRPDGVVDPTGLVKGWSIDEAAAMLEEAGARNYCINAGGDVMVSGETAPAMPWRVGVRHPFERDRVAAVLSLAAGAVATSGEYERGRHIVDPHLLRPPSGLLGITVVGPSLTYADAYATAAFAMGRDGPAWVAGHPGYGACAITDEGTVVWTPEAYRRRA